MQSPCAVLTHDACGTASLLLSRTRIGKCVCVCVCVCVCLACVVLVHFAIVCVCLLQNGAYATCSFHFVLGDVGTEESTWMRDNLSEFYASIAL